MSLNRREFTLSSLAALGAFTVASAHGAEPAVNRRFVLASRPVGAPTTENFRLESLKSRKGPSHFLAHEARIPDHVSGKDGGQPAFHARSPSPARLAARNQRIHTNGRVLQCLELASR